MSKGINGEQEALVDEVLTRHTFQLAGNDAFPNLLEYRKYTAAHATPYLYMASFPIIPVNLLEAYRPPKIKQ